MDLKLLSWAYSVKRRRDRRLQGRTALLPVLWLFTDERVTDPLAVIESWPRSGRLRPMFGVVIRATDRAVRDALAERLSRACRAQGIPMLLAGDDRGAGRVGVGRHLRGRNRVPGRKRRPGGASALLSCAVHDRAELVAASRIGARICFVSPVFRTGSHPGAPALGIPAFMRLAFQAERLGMLAFALGGLTANRCRSLSRGPIGGAAAIDALAQPSPRTRSEP